MYREPLSGDAVARRIDHEVLTVDEAEPPQLVEQREMMRRVARTGMQAADPINPSRFLRKRRERQCCRCTAKQRDELAPFHCPVSPVLPTERIARPGTAGDCCAAELQSGL